MRKIKIQDNSSIISLVVSTETADLIYKNFFFFNSSDLPFLPVLCSCTAHLAILSSIFNFCSIFSFIKRRNDVDIFNSFIFKKQEKYNYGVNGLTTVSKIP